MNDINLKDAFSIIRKYILNILIFLFLINAVAFASFAMAFNDHAYYINNQIDNNIKEYGEIDREQLCKIVACTKVTNIFNNKQFIPDEKGHLKVGSRNTNIFSKLTKVLYINDKYELNIYNNTSKSYYALNTRKNIMEYLRTMVFLLPLLIIIYLGPLFNAIKKEKEESILINAGSEALLANKSMINITENIHHELNTPLEVIDNKIEKIHNELSTFLIEEYIITEEITTLPEERIQRNKRLVKLNKDFEFIKTSSEQIYAVLEKMKGFKHLRYSNGNKSLKNIIDGGFKIINISNTNFEHKIDQKLDNYKIGTDKLKNADLLSILLNHFKNSLEANASKILILFNKVEDNTLYFRIIDNGNGIPLKAQKKIFSANFSTKKSDSGIRGNGMYLNKLIINNAGGEIELISSSNKGTTIELRLPILIK